MELWLRFRTAVRLSWDASYEVGCLEQWDRILRETRPLSSILWPTGSLFRVLPREPGTVFQRRHPHERGYHSDSQRDRSYRRAAQSLAASIRRIIGAQPALVYAPMRGAYPIWKAVRQFLADPLPDVYFPVTSSFVGYPEEWGFRNERGRTASGRYTHCLEIVRLLPLLRSYRYLVYLDEIVSGGVMTRYLQEMIRLGVHERTRIVAAGLADALGERSRAKRARIRQLCAGGKVYAFAWEGCSSLVTQDQKFLLGVHYVDYRSGLNLVPVLDEGLRDYPEKREFEQNVCGCASP